MEEHRIVYPGVAGSSPVATATRPKPFAKPDLTATFLLRLRDQTLVHWAAFDTSGPLLTSDDFCRVSSCSPKQIFGFLNAGGKLTFSAVANQLS